MGTTTSRDQDPYAYQSSGDVNAILQGMTDAAIDRQQERRNTQPLPAQLQPPPQTTSLAPAALPNQVQPGYQPNLPPQVQPNYTVQGTGPGTWWRQQQQNQPPVPSQFQPSQQQPVPLQPTDPGFRYTPPQNSERPPVNNMPQLWGGNQVGASGQTKQQFLLGRMAHESQGDPTALNYVARGDPRMYHPGVTPSGQQHPGYSASGILQDTNETWANGVKWAMADPDRYPMHGEDPSKYPVAGYAPWHVQWQVNSAIYDHAGETPWNERGGPSGAQFKGRLAGGFYNSMAEPTQNYAPAQPRSFSEWGRAPQGMGGSRLGEMPRHTDFGRIMGAIAPLMVGLVSLAARMPLSTAITAYGAMAKAQQNGQQLDYQRNRTRFQDQLKEHNAQQALESQEAGDAFSEYGNNNPQGLQQQLASIALKYNDPAMFRMAQNGDLNGIHQLQQRRDMGHQDLSKLSKAAQEEQDRRNEAEDLAARDKKWDEEHPDATPEERAIAHGQNAGLARQDVAGSGRGASGTQEERLKRDQEEDAAVDQDVQDRKSAWQAQPGNEDKEPTSGQQAQWRADARRAREKGAGGGGSPEQQVELAAARADLEDWASKQPTPPTEAQKQQKLAELLAQRHGAMQRQPAGKTPERMDIVDPDGSVIEQGRNLVPKPGGGWMDQDSGKDWTPPADHPNARPLRTTPSATGGGRAGAQVLRQLVGGREVLSDLQNAVRLPVGTTIGPLGTVHPGVSVRDALVGDVVRKLTDQDSQLMQASMASMERELSVLMSPVYGGNWAAQQITPLIPKSGDTLGTVMFKLARLAQSADNALEATSKSPILSNEEKAYARELRRQISDAIPWSTSEAMDFAHRGGRPRESFGEFVQRQGIAGGGDGTPAPPKVGDVHDGYRFKGGNPADPKNWEKP